MFLILISDLSAIFSSDAIEGRFILCLIDAVSVTVVYHM